ncbi:MAG: hypothetical protein KKH12_06370 [Gammaproteobacteria bacterium]|nr:hypothetical protein [Gammaproteobacteria bacterium]MBU1481285.1 hypothetical protein [Gammaproteobacteria bacterium]
MKTANHLTLSALTITFATLTTTCAYAINPQPEPPGAITKGKLMSPVVNKGINPQPEPPKILKGMTASQFQSLAPSTVLEIRGKKIPKSEIVKALDKSRAAAAAKQRGESRKFAAELQKRSSDLQARQKMTVRNGNIAIKAKFASLHAVSVRNDARVAPKTSISVAPQITEVHAQDNIFRPGSWVAIKGNFLGSTPGQVSLTGNFPGGMVPLIIMEWYNDAIMVEVPTIEGAPDQTATLQVLASGDRKATSQVQFIAERVADIVPASLLSIAACSHNASFHNACKIETSSNMINGEHQNLPDAAGNTSGTDNYTIKPLKNGWKAAQMGGGMLAYNCNLSGNAIACPWTTEPETATANFGPLGSMTTTITSNIYSLPVVAEGPRGVPMQ